jgi:tetratricopeptide (TPR) repeat protein
LLSIFCGISAAQATQAQLEVSETFFTLAAALNGCGYDAGLDNSLTVRQAVRAEVLGIVSRSPEASRGLQAICEFQQEHMSQDPGRDVSQYVSLALNLGQPPDFAPVTADADLPPDAAYVLGVVPLLQRFYRTANMHAVWQKHQSEYDGLVQRFHNPIANAITQTDVYLRLQVSGFTGARFVIYLEPLLSPAQVNSRNYRENYFLVISPGQDGSMHVPEIRHTYLHYVLEPLARKRGLSMERLDPLLQNLQRAPMESVFKQDISLLVTESLIRAIEARMIPGGKAAEAQREESVQHAVEEGFTLTHYFYAAMLNFEKDPAGITNAYGDLLYNIDLEQEKKRAARTQFLTQAAPELVAAPKLAPHREQFLDDAERRLASGDPEAALKLALLVINNPKSTEDQGRAFFILARASSLQGDMQSARSYFERAVESAHDPRTLAWSHIYLGRIFDIQEQHEQALTHDRAAQELREQALTHYRAALQAGDATPDTKTAAEKGLAGPYQPPARP